MELSWSTFLLEIINFLVLVWILKHFLYTPILNVIARRQAGIEKTLEEAKRVRADALKLQEQYESRMSDWEQERQGARDELAREVEDERTIKRARLHDELEQVREKARGADDRRRADAQHRMEQRAMLQAAQFGTRLLAEAAGPETEARLVDMLIAGLTSMTDERVAAIRNGHGQSNDAVSVVSAHPLGAGQRARLEQAIQALTGPGIPVRYACDAELLAGIRMTVGAWVLGANLRDELKGFAELAHDG